ncbi:flavin-containing monooxygenase [Rhodococcus tukisamuensis]|uniref:Cyclohexanone monooxygenase n=1 Tax=Rhodococcus tukisamuensis TaxID=168276 RepID=A0A1G7CM68_9NOCA|nr:NAD(P)/FAD-dependent oxidoreductase [Rhodococcus tukisamuensis]SDE39756.1 cyclohexanone monooxygenase [Rhodococcus tukisamuensis]
MSLPVTDNASDTTAAVRTVDTLIIGSGFAGLGAAIKLTQAGKRDFLVLERGSEVGGTWRDNTYPGAACDVPSHLYSYSFALNPEWTRSFSTQPEIQKYISSVAHRYNVLDKHVFGCDVRSAHWNAATSRWDVHTSKGDFEAKIVVSAIGALCEPSLPDIKGIEDFRGEIFHSARWNHDADLAGKRVAVIGTGASAIQIVPQLAKTVAQLDVYQRTAPWLLPRADREYTTVEHLAFKYLPGFQRLCRAGIYWMRETQVVGLAKAPVFMKPLELTARFHLRRQIKDKQLRKKVTPNFQMGCKRMLISNNYYPALAQANTELVTDGIAEVTANSVVDRSGTTREVDAIVIATGFHVTDSPTFAGIFGKDGRSAAEVFDASGQQGYKGSAIANFPNMFFLVGPNTGLGHTSMVFMIESQINYLVDALETIDRHGIGTIEVRQDAQDQYNRELQAKLSRSVWNNGGCASWYLDKHGNNTTLWPGFTFEFRSMLRKFDLAAYRSVATNDLPTVGSDISFAGSDIPAAARDQIAAEIARDTESIVGTADDDEKVVAQ